MLSYHYLDDQIVPNLALVSHFMLVPVSFWHIPISLSTLFYGTQKNVPPLELAISLRSPGSY